MEMVFKNMVQILYDKPTLVHILLIILLLIGRDPSHFVQKKVQLSVVKEQIAFIPLHQ
jgi:hypothetical protein